MRHFIESKSIVTLLMRFQSVNMFDKVVCRSLLCCCFTVGIFKHALVGMQVMASLIAASFLIHQFKVTIALKLVDESILRSSLLLGKSVVSNAKVWAFQGDLMFHLL